ncbi:hypothetical protein LCM4577_16525 [Mesorhizobium sp. LCM 4577]|nr:hypothetical protein LCM4577_16525 [Mesorhizobium sp. LCM 4577]
MAMYLSQKFQIPLVEQDIKPMKLFSRNYDANTVARPDVTLLRDNRLRDFKMPFSLNASPKSHSLVALLSNRAQMRLYL